MSAQVCTFWADGLQFAVGVEHVQEVLRTQVMTPVPRAPEEVLGLINLRGQIVTAVDFRTRLALTPPPDAEGRMNVIVRSGNDVVSLVVDQIGDVLDTDGIRLQPVPSNLPATVRSVLTGVLTLPDAILLVVDPHQAVELPGALAETA